jgi:hypothetical protein
MDNNKDGRLALAAYSFQHHQVSSERRAATLYNVSKSTLQDRRKGARPRKEAQAKNRLLLPYEERELINWIGSM